MKKMTIKKISEKITDSLLNDDFRQRFLVLISSALLSIISFISAIPHYMDDVAKQGQWTMAIILTVVFIVSTLIFLLTLLVSKYHHIWRRMLMALFILLFGYFCWDGGPQGFIHLWILLIPAFSFITFGINEGFIVALPTFAIMTILFWSPLHAYIKFADETTGVSVDFRLRMTLVYLVCLILGFIAELLRYVAAKRLKQFNEHFQNASLHDPLTNLANQNYLSKYLEDIYENKEEIQTLGCLFIDVDGFKNVNDKYGHLFGNVVLTKIAETLSLEKDAFACRWGGDEFVVCYKNIDEGTLLRLGEKYRATIAAYRFEGQKDFHITISVGAVVLPVDETFTFDHVLDLADSANRSAKKKGKDNVSLAD